MKKPRATAITCVALTLGGLTTGCDLAFLEDVIREGLATGLQAQVEKIPGLILGPFLGTDDTEDDTEADETM